MLYSFLSQYPKMKETEERERENNVTNIKLKLNNLLSNLTSNY